MITAFNNQLNLPESPLSQDKNSNMSKVIK